MLVPYAVEVDGHIITVFDPVVHRADASADDELLDPRWVRCQRPCITVGGELSAAMLELRLDESTRVFISPCQMKANNGILIIDDFGRQVLTPRELLNRWIVPLDRRVDYLTLASGMKFQVPFELMVVFSTNLDPKDLADEAFLRRIQTKVLVENVSDDVFDQIFQRVLVNLQVPCEPGCAEYLRERCQTAAASCLRACYPVDIYKLVKAINEYEGRPVRMSRANIDRAVGLYFARDRRGSTRRSDGQGAPLLQNAEHVGEVVRPGPEGFRGAAAGLSRPAPALGWAAAVAAVHDQRPGAGKAQEARPPAARSGRPAPVCRKRWRRAPLPDRGSGTCSRYSRPGCRPA